jgi:N-acetyl-gamma-glutamyl-phosphate reductase
LLRTFEPPAALEAAVQAGDTVFLAASHEEAATLAPRFLERGAYVIDLSPEFRIAGRHGAVYGFPERYRAALGGAKFVANPGCYPTASLLALLPLAGLGDVTSVIIDAKSGITGAGRSPSTAALFAEVEGDVRAYGLSGHRHEPEILQEIRAFGNAGSLLFTPHVVPLSRGMLADVYCTFEKPVQPEGVTAAFAAAYNGNPFVRLVSGAPSLRAVAYTNDAELFVSVHGAIVRVLCAIDNLGKGAAGQAVQNFNLMHGYPEETALNDRALAH